MINMPDLARRKGTHTAQIMRPMNPEELKQMEERSIRPTIFDVVTVQGRTSESIEEERDFNDDDLASAESDIL